MADDDEVTILSRTGPGSTPQEPLALVAKMSDSERSALASDGRSGLGSAAEPDTGIRYRTSIQHSSTFLFVTSQLLEEVYYLLYADDCGVPSKVAFDPEEPPLGRIRADSVAPPQSLDSIKRCISRVERNPALVHANVFADISCIVPLKEGQISILGSDGPGLSPDEPMAVVQTPIVQKRIIHKRIVQKSNVQKPIVQVESPIPDGRYVIKNRATDFFWNSAGKNPIEVVRFYSSTEEQAKNFIHLQVRSILQLFKCVQSNSLFRSGKSHMMIMVTSP